MPERTDQRITIRQSIALLMLGQEKPVQGRTVLQKQLYFYSVLSGNDFGYDAHYYGPYSADVAANVDSLVSSGWISNEQVSFGLVNAFGPVVRNDMSASDLLKKNKSTFDDDNFTKASELLTLVSSHEISDIPKLISLAAKLHFIHTDTGERSLANLEKLTDKYGWDIAEFSKPEKQLVWNYYQHVGLAK